MPEETTKPASDEAEELHEINEGAVEIKTKNGSVRAKWWTIIAIVFSIVASAVVLMYAAKNTGIIELFKK